MPGTHDYEMGGMEPEQSGTVTPEECEGIGDMLWGIPVMLAGDHLEPPLKMRSAWDKALCRYCNKKGIDPEDYLFDELPLLVATAQIGLYMKKAHKVHKGDKLELSGGRTSGFDSTTGYSEDHTEVEKKPATHDGASGTNLPEELTEGDKNGNEKQDVDAGFVGAISIDP